MEDRKIYSVLGLMALWLGCLGDWSPSLQAQSGKLADWLTDGGDIERTAWQKNEHLLSTTSVKNMKLLWKTKLDNEPRQMHNLLPALIIGRVNTSAGPKQMVIVTGVSDNIYALDAETGELLWKHHFETSWTPPSGRRRGAGILCPGGITATPVIGPTDTPGKYMIYAAAWDGTLRRLNVADGKEVAPPAKFMPPNGKPYALNLVNNVIYTHTAQGCGGNPNMVYTYDLATDKVGSWGPAGGGMWGRTGPAISSTGVMYTGTGDGPWDPENGVLWQRHHRREAEPADEGRRAGGLLRPVQRRVALQARPGYAGHSGDLQIQRQRIDGGRGQGVRGLPDGHRIDRRRRPSHAVAPHAADLQRRGQLRLGGHLGFDGELGRLRRAHAGC